MQYLPQHSHKKASGGYLLVLILVFGAIFFLSLSALAGFIVAQKRAQNIKTDRERAVQIAEAGLDYYKWYLAHYPNDLTNGTTSPGPYQHTYTDPEGGDIGTFSLDISGNTVCDEVTSIDITSTGWTLDNPDFTRTVYGRYARPSVSEFAYIINSNVWAGSDRNIVGPYHSNGGIRMDGTNNSTVSSGVADWLCTSSFGCSPDTTQNGVFGAGSGSALWEFPVAPIDFAGITIDLANMKTIAQADGVYVGPSGNYGYHVIFRDDDTFDLFRVTGTTQVWGYNSTDGWQLEEHIISSETFLGNNAIPGACSLIFIEDKLWIEGEISTKATIAAADVTIPNVDPSIILPTDITYTAADGSVGLVAIAEDSVLIPLNSPDVMTLEGIFIAQNGRFGRNYYSTAYLSSTWDPFASRAELNMTGSIVSNGRVGTQWTCGGVYCSGYAQRNNTYDRNLATAPPPLTPHVSDTYRFIEWQEIE